MRGYALAGGFPYTEWHGNVTGIPIHIKFTCFKFHESPQTFYDIFIIFLVFPPSVIHPVFIPIRAFAFRALFRVLYYWRPFITTPFALQYLHNFNLSFAISK